MAIGGVQPDFVFLVLYVIALKTGSLPAIYVGFFVGLCQDLYSPALLGQNALCKSLLGFFCGLFNERMMSTDPLMKAVLLVIAFLAHDLVFWMVDLTVLGDTPISILAELGLRSLPRALYSLAVAAMFYAWQRGRHEPIVA
jgi:rod shape-determining protein MreD